MDFGPQRTRVLAAIRFAALAIAVPMFALSGCESAPARLASARPAAARPPEGLPRELPPSWRQPGSSPRPVNSGCACSAVSSCRPARGNWTVIPYCRCSSRPPRCRRARPRPAVGDAEPVEVIQKHWAEAADLARLTESRRNYLWHRQVLNQNASYGFTQTGS